MRQQLKYKFKWWFFSLLSTLVSLSLGSQTNAQVQSCNNCNLLLEENKVYLTKVTDQEIFRNAYENRYTWGSKFPGYTAIVEFKLDNEKFKGNIRVNPDLSVEVTGIENEEVRQTIENQLRMNIVHRRRVPFEVAHKNNTFKLGNTDKTGAREIIEYGDKAEARYKVFRNQIIQVNRMMGPHAVTVDTLDSQMTPEGYLATRYRTTLYQPQNKRVLGEEVTEDIYEKINGYYLITRQVVQHSEAGERFNAEFNFTNIQLLQSNGK